MSEGGITGPQRVAAFLLSLDAEKATTLLRQLAEDVVPEVARAMIDLDPRLAEAGGVEALYRELALTLNGPRTVHSCGEEDLGRLLSSALGKGKGDAVLQTILERRKSDHPFRTLEAHPPARIAKVLARESAAVASLVLSQVEPALAADVIRLMPEARALETVRRMAVVTPPAAAVVRSIAQDLGGALEAASVEGEEADPVQRLQSIAELLNFSEPDIEKKVIEALAEDDAEMAAQLREFLFTWEDISTIDKRAMQKILGTVDTKTLSVALKACSEAVETNVLNNLSSRVREMVAEERELAGALPRTEVEAAREEIMKNIRAMIEAGEFRPTRAGEDLVS